MDKLSKQLSFVFFGTDEFSVKFLASLKDAGFQPALVVTMPDKPKGRKMVLIPPPVKKWAIENNIKFIQPANLKDPELSCQLKARSYQLFLVASYGKIIPQTILDLPKYGTLNIHPSLLPKYRGATPLESAVLSGDNTTGVTIIKVDAEMDHGPIIAQTKISLALGQPYYEELRDKLAEAGAKLLAAKIEDYLAGKIIPKEQDHSQATYTRKIAKTDGQINLNDDPKLNYRKIRAFTPWPGTYFFIHPVRSKSPLGGSSRPVSGGREASNRVNNNSQPFRVLIKKARLVNSELKIDRVLPEGRNEISWTEFETNYL
ncbi:MAG: methionyl-tRNA formyltransferase [Patescibacteria group bacterium]